MQFTYVQATGEALRTQKRSFRTSENEILLTFLCLWVIFALLEPNPDTDPGIPLNPDTIRIRIRIHSTAYRDAFLYLYSTEDDNERAAGERTSVEEEDNTPMEVDLEEEDDSLSRSTESTINKRTRVVTDR